MTDIQIFNNAEFGEIRAQEKDGQAWFNLNDVCKCLEIENPRNVKSRLKQDGVHTMDIIDILGRPQQATYINEANLYKAVFQSRKEGAERFTDWVVEEVLPTIRKHGAYMTPDTLEQMITSPEFGIKLLTALKDEQNKNRALQAVNSELSVKNAIVAPKAEYFDQLVERNLLTNFRDTAKEFSIKEREFIQFLLDRRFIYRDKKGRLLPYAEKNSDLFEVKECFNNATSWVGTQTLVTPKGRETFRLLIKK